MPSSNTQANTPITQSLSPYNSAQGTSVLPQTDVSQAASSKSSTAQSQEDSNPPSVRLAARQLVFAIHTRARSLFHPASSQLSSTQGSVTKLPTEARALARAKWMSDLDNYRLQTAWASQCLAVTRGVAKQIEGNSAWKGSPTARILGSQAIKDSVGMVRDEKDTTAWFEKQMKKAGFSADKLFKAPSIEPKRVKEEVERRFTNISSVAEKDRIITLAERTDYMNGVKQLLAERFPESVAECEVSE